MGKNLIEAVKTVKSGRIDPVYFLNGDDFFLQHFFIQELEKTLKKESDPEKLYLDPDEGDYPSILMELNTVSMFPEPKLFILRNPGTIAGKNRKEFLDYCRSPNRDNCLVIVIDKYDPRVKLVKELSHIVGSITVSTPFPEKIGIWVDYFLKQFNLTATDDAIDSLLELSGDSVFHLYNEMQKIALGVEESSVIEKEDVIRYAGWKRSYFPWQLLDAIGEQNLDDALLIGKRLLDQGLEVSVLISLMTTMFQELLFSHMEDGSGKGNVHQFLWLSSKVKKKLPQYKRVYSRIRINRIFRHLAYADERVKSSGGDPTVILIPLIYRITMNRD
ncbi:MAG: DNA polymerase III subunit delta [Candidatus Neomarinimicrobiota bacterium]